MYSYPLLPTPSCTRRIWSRLHAPPPVVTTPPSPCVLLSSTSSSPFSNVTTQTHPQLGVDHLVEVLRHMNVCQRTTNPTRLCLDSHHLNRLLLSDEYLHLKTSRNLDLTIARLLLDSSSLKMDMIGDTRRRQNTGLSRAISSRARASMDNNKVDRATEYQQELDEECKLTRSIDLGRG